MAEFYGSYPCHRVVDHSGRLAPCFCGQRELLLREGVMMKDETHVDIRNFKWEV